MSIEILTEVKIKFEECLKMIEKNNFSESLFYGAFKQKSLFAIISRLVLFF